MKATTPSTRDEPATATTRLHEGLFVPTRTPRNGPGSGAGRQLGRMVLALMILTVGMVIPQAAASAASDVIVPGTTDGTQVEVTTSVPTQNAKVTFACTKDVRYGVELTTTLPKNGWGAYPLNADGKKKSFSNTVKGASSLVGDWKADKSGTCAVVFDPVGTALGSATIKIWSVEP